MLESILFDFIYYERIFLKMTINNIIYYFNYNYLYFSWIKFHQFKKKNDFPKNDEIYNLI